MTNKKKFKCPECKCFLDLACPNSDASLACDSDCYFSEGEDGEKYLQTYIKKYPEAWKKLNSL
jgi:hypothetical protein